MDTEQPSWNQPARELPIIDDAMVITQVIPPQHRCDFCGEPATHCYREGAGTGHSEHMCACEKHKEE